MRISTLLRLAASAGVLALIVLVVAAMGPRTLGLGAVAARNVSLTPTGTASPAKTATPSKTAQPTKTVTPTKTGTPIKTPTKTTAPTVMSTHVPTRALTPTPTITQTPLSNVPPQSDGVERSTDVPILMYHYISAPPSPGDRLRMSLSVPPENFNAQMKLLVDNGFHTISLRDLYEHLATGKALPKKPIVLTFDDGYADNYQNAYPILRKHGMIGTFFVLTGPPDEGNPNYLTWDMITEMSDAGMDIQLHSRDHYDMRNRSFEWLVFQIIGGRQSIEGHTNKPVIFMAYPSGKYDANVLRFLSGNNFWAAVTTASGEMHKLSDALTWTRTRISGYLSLESFGRLVGISK